ncbi:MAG: hypothetical protein K0S33_4223 [Bacteroidetes bacterium]|jgi:hypothetical protein|nr:hypothetical protein [Bacteroidota bacterium]
MKIKFLTSLTLSAFAFFVSAQKPVELSLKLRDGSNVSGTSTMADINLITDYGKLVIPTKNVTSIQVGIPTDKASYDKAKSFLSQLGNTNEEVRRAAYEELVKIGIKAIPAISDYINDPKNTDEYNGEFTPDNALNELKSNANVDEYTDGKDIIDIDGQYTIGGTYEFSKIEVKTEYGNLSIPKEKIKSIDVMFISGDGSNEFSFKLVASKNISANTAGGWLKTGIKLKNAQHFTITASGEVVLASLSNQKYKPDGSYESSTGEKYPTTTDEYSSTTTYPAYGNVVYKIGEASTTALKAGAKYSGSATSAGMLYLAIYETVYNASNTGSYNVKVSLK